MKRFAAFVAVLGAVMLTVGLTSDYVIGTSVSRLRLVDLQEVRGGVPSDPKPCFLPDIIECDGDYHVCSDDECYYEAGEWSCPDDVEEMRLTVPHNKDDQPRGMWELLASQTEPCAECTWCSCHSALDPWEPWRCIGDNDPSWDCRGTTQSQKIDSQSGTCPDS